MAATATRRKLASELTVTDDTRDASQVWTVISDTVNPSETSILAVSGLPQLGASHENNFHLRVTSRSVTQIAPTGYEVDIRYTMPDDGAPTSGGQEDPIAKPTEITYATVLYQEPMDEDAKGDAVVTANKEPFDPPIMVDYADLQITVTRNFRSFRLADWKKFQGHTNADEWLGYEPYTALVTNINAREFRNASDGTTEYFRVSVTVQFRDRTDAEDNVVGWRRRIIHQGFNIVTGERNDDGTFKISHAMTDAVPATDTTPASPSVQVTEPVLLTELGFKLPKGDPTHFLLFEPYKTESFSAMNLGI